jgi:ATP-binding cassette, subfamily G (WHITE), member 2, PDR
MRDIEGYKQTYPPESELYDRFAKSRKAQQAKRQRLKCSYTLSCSPQIRLCLWRGFRRLAGAPSLFFEQVFGNCAIGLILGSVFFNLQLTAGK